MKRVHQTLLSPNGLMQTLQGIGVRGIAPSGALAWQTYPVAAQAPLAFPGAFTGVDGAAIGLIAPNLLAVPYIATHLNWTFNFNSGLTGAGNRVLHWNIQDSLGVTRRAIRFQNPAKDTGGVRFGESPTANLFPLPMPPTMGIQARLASSDVSGEIGARAYLTALLVQPQIIPSLLAVAPTALGAMLPTTAAGTALTSSATAWSFGSYVQLSAGLTPAVLVTAVTISSSSGDSGQVAFATGAGGSEIDWGVFGWAEPLAADLVGTRYDLQPYPLYIPPSTRIAARCRGIEAGATFNVGLEYIPLPIR